jgi:hypothetical protein
MQGTFQIGEWEESFELVDDELLWTDGQESHGIVLGEGV